MRALPAACQKPSGRSRTSGDATPGASTNSTSPPIRRKAPQYTSSMRASTRASTASPPARQARASRLPTATKGTPAPTARPWAAPQATRRPVNAPGPLPKAMASRSGSTAPASCSSSRTKGRRVSLCGRPLGQFRTKTRPSSQSAHEPISVEVSRANSFIGRHCTGRPSSTLFGQSEEENEGIEERPGFRNRPEPAIVNLEQFTGTIDASQLGIDRQAEIGIVAPHHQRIGLV